MQVSTMFFFAGNQSSAVSLSTIPNNLCFKHKRNLQIPSCHVASKKAEPLIVAHRGNFIDYQENSFEAFTSLIGKGIDGVEIDVYLTKDKKLVAFHDENTLVSNQTI